jgi:voltage-gated potassium channel
VLALLLTLRQLWQALRAAGRDPEFRSLGAITLTLLGLGTLFYHGVEGWRWLDSLYFCVITLATVGYGDLSPQTDLGKIFTMVYILIGIGILVALFTRLAAAVVAARPDPQLVRRRLGRDRTRLSGQRRPRGRQRRPEGSPPADPEP